MVEEIIPLWTHQREAAMRALKCGSYGFFFEQGTGKSLTTVYTLRNIYARNGVLIPTIIQDNRHNGFGWFWKATDCKV